MRRVLVTLSLLIVMLLVGAIPALAQQGGFYYTAQGGDTLASIAARYNISLNTLMASNGLSNPNVVFAGQTLFIPGSNFGTGGPIVVPAPQTPPVVVIPPVSNPVLRQTYTVQPGDTLLTIAVRFGVTVPQLAQLNGISDINLVQAGRVIVLPSNAVDYGTGGPVVRPARPFRYEVQPGDYLEKLALRYGTTVRAIAQLNNLANPSRIDPYQVILIP